MCWDFIAWYANTRGNVLVFVCVVAVSLVDMFYINSLIGCFSSSSSRCYTQVCEDTQSLLFLRGLGMRLQLRSGFA